MSNNSSFEINIPALSGRMDELMQHLSDAFGGMDKCWEIMEIEVKGKIDKGMTISWKHAPEKQMRLNIIKAIGDLDPLIDAEVASKAIGDTQHASQDFDAALTDFLGALKESSYSTALARLKAEEAVEKQVALEL